MSEQSVRTRFAPSPTGYLHVGGARTALFNWLYAKKHNGTFVLRVEDTDAARNTEAARDAIFGGLRWLGITWDEGPEIGGDHGPYFQSERKEIYDRYFAQLDAAGHVYDDAGAARFRSPGKTHTVEDHICGTTNIDRSSEPDMTIRRPDGSYIFHFVNVVDDIEMKISHVIRGEDHLMNTAKHLELYEAFGATPPQFAHIPLILNEDGSKMSKRDQGASISSYLDEGFLPEAVRNYLCLLGWNPKDEREKLTIDDVITLFDWDHLNRSNAKFDLDKCRWLSGQYLADLSPESFLESARPTSPDAPDSILALTQPRVRTFSEIPAIVSPILDAHTPIAAEPAAKLTSKPETLALATALADRLATLDSWSPDSIQTTVKATATDLGVKPGALMFPLRLLSTGVAQGTDLLPTLTALGQENVVSRIRSRLAILFPTP